MTLSNHRIFAKNILWNFLGLIFPAVTIIVFIPILIKNLGDFKFGILTLAWTLIGFLSLFDFGVSRSLTHSISVHLSEGNQTKIDSEISTSIIFTFLIGIIFSILIYLFREPLTNFFLKNPTQHVDEIYFSVVWICLGLPFTLTSTILKGAFDGLARFDISNLIRIPLTLTSYAAPALFSYYSNSVSSAVLFVLLSRILANALYLILVYKIRSEFKFFQFDFSTVKNLMNFGGWLAVTNFISPLMYQIDRFFISASIGVSAITYYATPVDSLTKLFVIPGAILSVTFPAIAYSKKDNQSLAKEYYELSMKLVLFFVLPITLTILFFSNELISLWIGVDFARQTNLIFQIIAIGVLVNCIAQNPYTLIQAWGKPDWTAKLHLIELPIYIFSFYFLLKHYGLLGASIAWTGRIFLDAILLSLTAKKINSWNHPVRLTLAIFIILAFGILAMKESSLFFRSSIFIFGNLITLFLFFKTSQFRKQKSLIKSLLAAK